MIGIVDKHRQGLSRLPTLEQGAASTYPAYKRALTRALLKFGGVRRIHIIGVSRSGTTMLHYALCAFVNTVLYPEETDVSSVPGIWQSMRLALAALNSDRELRYITKRAPSWYYRQRVETLLETVRGDRIGLLQIVRDPRDVLTSQHARVYMRRRYVDLDRWRDSVRAADYLFAELADYPDKLTVRYEDVIRSPEATQCEVQRAFGLELRPGIRSWAALEENVHALGLPVKMPEELTRLRNFDTESIGRWRHDPSLLRYVRELQECSRVADELKMFNERFGYD